MQSELATEGRSASVPLKGGPLKEGMVNEETETQGTEDGLTLEQLNAIETNIEVEKKVGQSTQLPAGWYNSVPELTMTLGKAKTTGRAYARFFGAFKPTAQNTSGREGKTGFGLSWEIKYNDTGKADLMSRLWVSAAKTYRVVHQLPEDEVVTVAAVLQFLQKYAVAVRFGTGNDDNITFQIAPIKE